VQRRTAGEVFMIVHGSNVGPGRASAIGTSA
jgi:hypothetical protein